MMIIKIKYQNNIKNIMMMCKDKITERHKQYYNNNKDKIKQYDENNKDKKNRAT